MYPKHENEGDLSFDTKEKMEIYHMPSIICLRLLVMLDFYANFRQRRWSLQLRQGVRGLQALQLPRLPQLLLQVPLLQEVGGRDECEPVMKGLANADFYLSP